MDIGPNDNDKSKRKDIKNDIHVIESEGDNNNEVKVDNVKSADNRDDNVEGAEEENIEKISQTEAEERFLLWYNDIQGREEWYKRRIEELESLDEKHKQTIATLKDNDKKLQQRYSRALIEIKVLRKKNLSAPDDQAFLDSYTALSAERENLIKTSRENNQSIKTLKKEMFLMRTRLNLKHIQNLTRRDASSQTKMIYSEKYHKLSPKKNHNGMMFRHSKSLDEVKEFGGNLVRSKRWEEVTNIEKDTQKQDGVKESESVSLPDIRDRPGHIMWRY